jgi:hypothetical protein
LVSNSQNFDNISGAVTLFPTKHLVMPKFSKSGGLISTDIA